MALIRRAWANYDRLLRTHPVVTPALTTGVLMGVGDILAQSLEGYSYRRMSFRRTAKVFLLGACAYGPMLNKWYHYLSHRFADRSYRVLKMVAADQLLMAPVSVALYVSAVSALNTGTVDDVVRQFDHFPEIMLTNYKLWPAVQVLNFTFAPYHLRLLVVNCVTIVWNTYLSWVAHRPRVVKAQPIGHVSINSANK